MQSPYAAKFSCPGCGSPLETPEGTISLRCSFCGLNMRIGAPGRLLKYYYQSPLDDFALKFVLERYFKERGEILDFAVGKKQLYYLPFYRFRGMIYSLLFEMKMDEELEESNVSLVSRTIFHQKCRHFDINVPGFVETAFGLDSLGIRPEVVSLNFFIKENIPADSILLDLVASPQDAKQKSSGLLAFNLGIALEDKECVLSEMIAEGLSVIYYPVWVCYVTQSSGGISYFIDGLSKKVIQESAGVFECQVLGMDESQSSIFSPVAHKCSNCGFDLPVSENSIVYYCSNCSRSYIISGDEYMPLNTEQAVFEQGSGHYPFWRIPLTTANGLKMVGEFAKILTGEIPLIARNKSQNRFYLYIPAFKLPNLESLTTRALRLCRTQPILEYSEDIISPKAEVILPEYEARELAMYYWLIMRAKYRQLMNPMYEFKYDNTSASVLVWLTMADTSSSKIKAGNAANYA